MVALSSSSCVWGWLVLGVGAYTPPDPCTPHGWAMRARGRVGGPCGVSIPHHFLPIYHGKEVLHQPIDQIVGINHSDKVAPPQSPPIYTKTVENVLNTAICDL
jgi:hypothetical protein